MQCYGILIEAKVIPNYDEIKRRYFDNEGNKLEVINYQMFDTRPYLTFTPVMYSDGDGHYAVLTALLIGAGIGALTGGVIAGVSGAISGDRGWDIVRDALAGSLTGAALGLSLSAGGLVGVGAISGFAVGGTFVGTTAISYGAGAGAYAIKNAGKTSFTYKNMFDYAGKTAVNSMFNFAVGYFFGSVGAWDNIGDGSFAKIRSDVIQNSVSKHTFIKSLGIYTNEFGLQMVGRSLVRSGIWWLLNEL